MIQKNEKIFLTIIIGYFLTIFSIIVIGTVIASQISEPIPVELVTVFENGTTESSVKNVDAHSIVISFLAGFSNFSFMIPLIIAGVGVWLPLIAIRYDQLPTYGYTAILVLSFWIFSMVSIPITIKFSKGIPLWRRIPCVYFIAVLIGGTAIWLWTGFGN